MQGGFAHLPAFKHIELLLGADVIFQNCDRLWENPAKVAMQNSEKRGKVLKKLFCCH
jgi:hypothetical protein